MPPLRLHAPAETLAVVRLDANAAVPVWAASGSLSSVTRTPDELSIVCRWDAVPDGRPRVGPWRAFVVEGPLDFELVGVLSRLSGILADARIPLLALSTHDTDWILVRSTHVDAARVAFESAGIPVSDADQDASEVT